jgi:preprotein translocase subunit YajC
MFDSLPVLALIIIIFWVSLLGYYVYLSRQQQGLQEDIKKLRSLLQESDEDDR